jgi:radical SAM protein with 4Fe4S-binding SPASM domain
VQELNYHSFTKGIGDDPEVRRPLSGVIELTYRCNLSCVHCYSQNAQAGNNDPAARELTAEEWQEILDEIYAEGCLWLTISGGEPLLRKDFPEIYAYARRKGFLISIFTNATLLTPEILGIFRKYRPFSIEISLYGSTRAVYESITGVPGSFEKAKDNIARLLDIKLPLVFKTVGLKQNKEEILKVKGLAARLLGRGKFKFSSFIFPRINGDTAPCKHRLAPEEILATERSDEDMLQQRREQLHNPYNLKRSGEFLYHCTSWRRSFFINPYGLLQFCHLTKKYSCDVTNGGFKKGFYDGFPGLLNEKFSGDSRCRACALRRHCYFCPARAYLETGNPEGPVDYYCKLAEARYAQAEELSIR